MSTKSLLRRVFGKPRAQATTGTQGVEDRDSAGDDPELPYRRFLSDASEKRDVFLQAARDYLGPKSPMTEEEIAWLRHKPFDSRPGNEQFFLQMYSVMNLLQAMDLPPSGRVVEVGSGPGWVSELLMTLGFEVDAIEPCAPMIELATDRIEAAARHYRIAAPPAVRFHEGTLETTELPDESCDGVLFHDALHHIIDENSAIAQCFRVLKPGGRLGVSEEAWRPGNRMQESALEEEMERFGTLENPFTQEYLERLLTRHGFVNLLRYHAVNGWFPADMGDTPLARAAQSPASGSNNLTAEKPAWTGPSTLNPDVATRAHVELRASSFSEHDRKLHVDLRIRNTGETEWLHQRRQAGWVTVALRTERLGAPEFQEAQPRHVLRRSLAPGDTAELSLDFFLPESYRAHRWYVDLVNEGYFWFSERGTMPVHVVPEGSSLP